MKSACLVSLMAMVVTGCATGIVPLSPDAYVITDPGLGAWYSSSELRSGIISKAIDYCAEQGKQMVPLTDCVGNMTYVHFEHAEMRFQCLDKSAHDRSSSTVRKGSVSPENAGDGCAYQASP